MVVLRYGDFDHFPLKLIPLDLFHILLHAEAQNCRLKNKPSGLFFNLYPPLFSTAVAERRRAQGRPHSKGGQYQSAGADAALPLPLYFLDPLLYQRHAGFMAIHSADTPLSPNAGAAKTQKDAPRPRNDRGRSASLETAL